MKLQNRELLERNQLDPTTLVRAGVISGLRQLLEFGYFHADPHPGNLFASPAAPMDLADSAMSISA